MTDSQSPRHQQFFLQNGFTIVRSLFSAEECLTYREHYMQLRAEGAKPDDYAGEAVVANDPLKQYPRMICMHRWDKTSLRYLLDRRLNRCLSAFLGAEPLACQTMLYFKPPGARGQAMHQDNFYLRVSPGTCAAAWLALDDTDENNGCMQVVPGSHRWDTLCVTKADTASSFTDQTVPLPPGVEPVACTMGAGDVLFFNGQLVHGSFPNTTKDRFRRSLIAHYVNGHAERVTPYCKPVLRMDGTEAVLEDAPGGGPCGRWVTAEGRPVIEMSGRQGVAVDAIH